MKKTLIALMALAGVVSAAERTETLWTMEFGTDIGADGTTDYTVSGSYTPSGVWDVDGLTGTNYVSTNGKDKRVHTRWNNGSGMDWSKAFEIEIVFTLPEATGFVTNSKWPVVAELSGNGTSLRFGPYTQMNNEFYVDGALSKDTVTTPVTLTLGATHTAVLTVIDGQVTLSLDGVVAQTGTLNAGASGQVYDITLGGNSSSDYRMSEYVHSITAYKVAPEPTTATLSLLALAGLAARRRRR